MQSCRPIYDDYYYWETAEFSGPQEQWRDWKLCIDFDVISYICHFMMWHIMSCYDVTYMSCYDMTIGQHMKYGEVGREANVDFTLLFSEL